MRGFRIVIIWFGLFVAGVVYAQPEAAPIAPSVFLRGLQLSEQVRYTASFIKPSDDAVLRNVSVEITLPPDALFTEMLVTRQVQFDVVRKNRQGALTLIWQISRVASDTPLDAFSFTLAQPLTSAVEFYLQWQSEDGTQFVENFLELPPVMPSNQAQGQVTVSQEGFLPVGETGVQVSFPLQPTAVGLTARLLPADFNPPPEFQGIWWCSILELTGVPGGISAEVVVPLRRPLAPFTTLQLFHQQQDGSWIALDGQALVTADGQYALYSHPGGVVATGGEEGIQPEIKPVTDIQIEVVDTAPPAPPPPSDNQPPPQQITDGSSNTVIIGEAPPQPPVEQITDGTSNTIVIGESPVQPPVNEPPQVADGTSNTIIIGEASPAPVGNPIVPTQPIVDGTSNTIIIGEASPAPVGNPPVPTQPIVDGTSNTIIISEASPAPVGNPPVPTQSIVDGTSNTIIISEASPAPIGNLPVPTQSIVDGTSNTIIIGEASPVPVGNPPVPTQQIVDGTSNTIIIGEASPAPVGNPPVPTQQIVDGTSNTIIISEASPAPVGNPVVPTQQIVDGTSNTIIIGEASAAPVGNPPVPTQQIVDGTSNTIIIGESSPTITPTTSTGQSVTVTPVTPGLQLPVTQPVTIAVDASLFAQHPLPFGQGGARIILLNQEGSGLLQCQVGLVNCAVIRRTPGAGLR